MVSRQDLQPGYILTQCIHSTLEFFNEHPEPYKNWFNFSKAITLLAVPNEDSLKYLIRKLTESNIRYSIFIEPDINNQVTAITIEPGEASSKLCSSIPLALKQYNHPNLINKHSLNKNIVHA